MAYDRLDGRAASFLRRESPRSPLHVGSLALFEAQPFVDGPFVDGRGRFRLDDAREHVAGRLHRSPVMRRRVQPVPFGQGRPVWVEDGGFDLAYHVRLTALPRPGGEEQLLALMARIQAIPLDRRRPLWELWFVDGVDGDRVAVIQKTHLALGEGLGPRGSLEAILDEGPPVQPLGAPPLGVPPLGVPQWTAHKAPNNVVLLAHSLAERAKRPPEMARVARAALRGPRRAVAAVGRSRASLEIGSRLHYEIARAGDASADDVRGAVHSVCASAAVTFETLPGPRYLLGARLLEAFSSAPPVGKAPAVAVLAYAGRLGIGLTSDRAASVDLGGLADALERALDEPGAAAG